MKGVATLITVIILGALMTLIGTAMTLTSISEGQMTLSDTKAKKNQSLLDSCAEQSLYNINVANTLPVSIITPNGNCTTTLNSQVGTSWDYVLNATGEMSSLGVNIRLNRGASISVSSWLDQ